MNGLDGDYRDVRTGRSRWGVRLISYEQHLAPLGFTVMRMLILSFMEDAL